MREPMFLTQNLLFAAVAIAVLTIPALAGPQTPKKYVRLIDLKAVEADGLEKWQEKISVKDEFYNWGAKGGQWARHDERAWAVWDLERKYTDLTLWVGIRDKDEVGSTGKYRIFTNGELVKSGEVEHTSPATRLSIKLSGAKSLRIEVFGRYVRVIEPTLTKK
jgi:hypothetical protein